MATLLKRIAIFIFAVVLIIPVVPSAEAAEPEEYGFSLLENDAQKIAYLAIEAGIEKLDTEIEFQCDSISGKDVQFAVKMVLEDHPDFFWFDGAGQIAIYDYGRYMTVVFTPNEYSVDGKKVTRSNIKGYIDALDEAAAKALKNLPQGNDLEKCHYLHDYVAEQVTYEFTEDDQTAYGALAEGRAVCAGYARAYQYLLKKAGIKSWYVTGYGLNPITGATDRHGWNVVFLDGKCYYTDVTWDDQTETFHAYFMLSLEEISQTHVPDNPEYLPSCGHRDKDYFVVHSGEGAGVGILKAGYTANQLASFMKKVNETTWSCHVEDVSGGNAQQFKAWLDRNAIAIGMALGIRGGFSYFISDLWDEYQITFTSTNTHQHTFPLLMENPKAPTCTESGKTSYYICASCNGWFLDEGANNEIFDKSSVNISAKGHSFTKLVKDLDQHWTVCSDCGLESTNSREAHYDKDRNGKCDVCTASVALPTEPTVRPTAPETTVPATTPSIVPPTTAPTTTPTTEPTAEPTVEPTTEPTEVPTTEPTEVPTTAPTIEPTILPSAEPSTDVNTEPTEATEEMPTEEPSEIVTEPSSEPSTEPTVPSIGASEATMKPTAGQDTPSATEGREDKPSNTDVMPFLIAGGIVAAGAATTGAVLLFRKRF